MTTETRYQRIAREQSERQAARDASSKKASQRPARRRPSPATRSADRIDGYDRDDLGMSPDY